MEKPDKSNTTRPGIPREARKGDTREAQEKVARQQVVLSRIGMMVAKPADVRVLR